ncbi:MAG TPA: HD domain-containing protein [Solirubrobacteraceae bacterium]|nr:HD domain-containing protein [Solirubrobacteraceae bacterium]
MDRLSTLEFSRALPKTQVAVEYARRLHEGQRRQVDGQPFILHPLEVGALLYQAGAPDDVVAAGLLHDTIEKSGAAESELSHLFGAHVTGLVRAVTEDDQIKGYAHRKAALRDQVAHAGEEALMLFAADKVSKARELSLDAGLGVTVRKRRLTHYRRCLALLQERLPDFPLVGLLARELELLSDRGIGEHATAPCG